jgi:hypothetical protein
MNAVFANTPFSRLWRLPFLVTSLHASFICAYYHPIRGRELPVASCSHGKKAKQNLCFGVLKVPYILFSGKVQKKVTGLSLPDSSSM